MEEGSWRGLSGEGFYKHDLNSRPLRDRQELEMTSSVRRVVFLGIALILAVWNFQITEQQVAVPPVSEPCLGCICEAISNCNRTLTCSGDVCGLFRITWAYWADAGKPVLEGDVPTNDGAYSRCVTEPYCAARAVRGYMARFAQDCNQDGVIDCQDFARIHLLGGYGCGGNLTPLYSQRFFNCMEKVALLSG